MRHLCPAGEGEVTIWGGRTTRVVLQLALPRGAVKRMCCSAKELGLYWGPRLQPRVERHCCVWKRNRGIGPQQCDLQVDAGQP